MWHWLNQAIGIIALGGLTWFGLDTAYTVRNILKGIEKRMNITDLNTALDTAGAATALLPGAATDAATRVANAPHGDLDYSEQVAKVNQIAADAQTAKATLDAILPAPPADTTTA